MVVASLSWLPRSGFPVPRFLLNLFSLKYFVSLLSDEIILKSKWCQGMISNKCLFKSPAEILSITVVHHNENILVWLPADSEYLSKLVTHWQSLLHINKCSSDCVLAVPPGLVHHYTNKFPVIAKLARGTVMCDVVTHKRFKLSGTISFVRVIPPTSTGKQKGITPFSNTLGFDAFVQQVRTSVLFDTGATNSFITYQLANKLGLKVEVMAAEAESATGSSLNIVGTCRATFSFGNFQCKYVLFVSRNLKLDLFEVILGMDWLTHFNALLDCQARTCTLR